MNENEYGQSIRDEIARNETALRRYTELLASYGGRIRLTGPSDATVLWEDHILDCAWSLPSLPASGAVIDVGSGGGLPGIVWAICRPGLAVTLLDSVHKKCSAMEKMSAELGLTNVTVAWARAEDFAVTRRESFDLAGARALAEAGIVAELLSPLVRRGGSVLAFKGPRYAEEIAAIATWRGLGLLPPTIVSYHMGEKERHILVWQKNAPCPKVFPRQAGSAEKDPWWR